jgi:hypothetical protein
MGKPQNCRFACQVKNVINGYFLLGQMGLLGLQYLFWLAVFRMFYIIIQYVPTRSMVTYHYLSIAKVGITIYIYTEVCWRWLFICLKIIPLRGISIENMGFGSKSKNLRSADSPRGFSKSKSKMLRDLPDLHHLYSAAFEHVCWSIQGNYSTQTCLNININSYWFIVVSIYIATFIARTTSTFKHLYQYLSLWIQIPSEKVLDPENHTPNSYPEDIWIHRP